MEPLKIFATLETPLSPSQLTSQFRAQGWRIDKNSAVMRKLTWSLSLEKSDGNLYLLNGHLADPENLHESLQQLVAALSQTHYCIDLFEEDGRLVRRVQA